MSKILQRPDVKSHLAEYDAAIAAERAASERATSEIASPAKVVAAVATGSLWVSASQCLQMALAWEHSAAASANQAAEARLQHMDTFADIQESRAQALLDCCQQLRLLTGEESLRQPTENIKMSQRRP